MGLYSDIQKKTALGEKMFAVLIDPDKHTPVTLKKIRGLAIKAGADLFLFGGSLLTRDILDEYLGILKSENPLPVVLFPGNNLQISN